MMSARRWLHFLLGICFVATVALAQGDTPEGDRDGGGIGTLPDDFDTNCERQREENPHITCQPDGSFTPIQCRAERCRCVDPSTGEPRQQFVAFSEDDEEIDCIRVFPEPVDPCASITEACTLVCAFGQPTDENGCEICECLPPPDDEDEESEEDEETTGDTTGTEDTTGTSQDGEDSTGDSRSDECSTVERLLRRGCTVGCIVTSPIGCPVCNRTCVDEDDGEDETCRSDEDCLDTQVCLRVGRFGQRSCVDLPGEGDECGIDIDDDDDDDDEESSDEESSDEDSSDEESRSEDSREDSTGGERQRRRVRRRIGGAIARRAVGLLRHARLQCREGLVCTRVGPDRRECRPENENGTCVQARQSDSPEASCDDDGEFEPTQCRRQSDGSYLCFCVRPDGTQVGDAQAVSDPDDAPDCDDLVFDRCQVEIGGERYRVRHREYFINPSNCTRCQCDNGEPAFCESTTVSDCSFRNPRDCRLRGEVVAHGESFQVDCNRCSCRNGRIRCTRRRCDDDDDDSDDDDSDDDDSDDDDGDDDDSCERCRRLPRRPVCAPNGRTYLSECFAVFCAGQSPADLLDGPCPIHICRSLFPCDEGEICVRRGGVSCFNRDGCDPDDVRLCVDPDDLECDDDDDEGSGDSGDGDEQEENNEQSDSEDSDGEDDEDEAVCGANGETYSSLCRLLQETGNGQVAYAGRCDRDECSGGPVCGTDGVTYDNVCVLRSQSANARVDYRGECDPDTETPLDEVCIRVSRARRCAFNASNCRRLVRPEEGCCALCGGIIYVAIDFSGLGDYVRINPSARTLDRLVEILLDSGFIPEETTDRCELEASFTNSGGLEITLVPRDEDADSEFCNDQSQAIADRINNPQNGDEPPPEVLQFASAAVAAPLILDVDMTSTPSTTMTPSGAAGLFTISSLALLVISLCALLL